MCFLQERKLQQKKSTRNYRDFKLAKKRLKAIIGKLNKLYLLWVRIIFTDRNAAAGNNWAFKITCQKDSKHSRQRSHCWQSDNYDAAWNSNEQNSTPKQVLARSCICIQYIHLIFVFRVCCNCKHKIVGPQWSYLVCGGKSCRQGMTHFKCIGFNGVIFFYKNVWLKFFIQTSLLTLLRG